MIILDWNYNFTRFDYDFVLFDYNFTRFNYNFTRFNYNLTQFDYNLTQFDYDFTRFNYDFVIILFDYRRVKMKIKIKMKMKMANVKSTNWISSRSTLTRWENLIIMMRLLQRIFHAMACWARVIIVWKDLLANFLIQTVESSNWKRM